LIGSIPSSASGFTTAARRCMLAPSRFEISYREHTP
jgi:hypothetical protein